jgi:hypothetical protein
MVESTTRSPLSDVVRDVRTEPRSRPSIQPRATRSATPIVAAPDLAMPDYVEHSEGTTEIGRLSAEAVVREYEGAAKEIELAGNDLIERAKQCEAMTRDAFAVTKELNEIAARYRQEAKRIFEHIEGCSAIVAEAQNICSTLRDKIAGPTAT